MASPMIIQDTYRLWGQSTNVVSAADACRGLRAAYGLEPARREQLANKGAATVRERYGISVLADALESRLSEIPEVCKS
jgi:hypothetical protein